MTANPTTRTPIHPDTKPGLLSLTVADIRRSIAFYIDVMGFKLLGSEGGYATLGVGDVPLIHLKERAGAEPWPRGARSYTGLYHFAILVPSREDLGRWLRHWFDLGLPMPGQGDHGVSEAIYLEDPDLNGIEIYVDRPRSQWQWSNGQVQMGIGPVDIDGLLEAASVSGKPWTGLSDGTKLGHIHLQVGDIREAERFYHDLLGFDVVAKLPAALFVSAGGYHHHVGMNTWNSLGADPAPSGSAGLRFFTLIFPNQEALDAVVRRLRTAGVSVNVRDEVVSVKDPWENTLVLQVGEGEGAEHMGRLSEYVHA